MPHELFISYSSQDQRIADDVCAVLEKYGISCWIDHRDIPPGIHWKGDIVDAIAECKMVLVLLSSQSNKSVHVPIELHIAAFDFQRAIIPLRIEDVPPSKELRYILTGHQQVNAFPPPLADYLEKLATDLKLRLIKLNSNSPEVRIVSPGVGEVWKPGMVHEIRWEVHAASDRTVQRLKLSLCKSSREIRILADSTTGFPAAANQFTWEVPSDMPPGEDYQLRLEIADDKSQPGSALVDFSLQRPAAAATEREKRPVVLQEPTLEEKVPTVTSAAPESGSPLQPQVLKSDTSEPTSGWSISELPFPSLPLGARLVCQCILCLVFLGGLAGACIGGIARWNETSPPPWQPPLGDLSSHSEKDSQSGNKINSPIQSGEGAKVAIALAETTESDETGIVSSLQKLKTRIGSCIGRAFYGILPGALGGLVFGASIGILWWIILAIAARVTRRPIEMVYDDWGSSYGNKGNQRRLESILGTERATEPASH